MVEVRTEVKRRNVGLPLSLIRRANVVPREKRVDGMDCLFVREGRKDEEVERTIYSHLLGRWRARSMGVKRVRLAVLRRRW